ncbi:unnamed protein product [[Candida] boidinii]|uniref:Unnamed protein product n=1 Tax=Candida boidinii TaxID=5477 RepID=A0A9W6WAX9_CANBO|nr:hypothetical protein BVG19_g4949 [[Candida] boidinii]OWB51313.1 hypothetical protein B5S27_g2873 [[Candida] boidinii]OWB67806.1 hypothetical protein B5S30_g3170 [[Candida] boidinii]OWB84784.1 hypothetical protein B5S33_g3437 [[Candida] boidinii]GME73142.1 unnamed protein product [[Candida] boidinii]
MASLVGINQSLRLSSYKSQRLLISPLSSLQLRLASTKVQTKQTNQRPAISKIGIPFEPYIPTRWSRMPNFFTSPKLFLKNIFKRCYLSAFNTVQVYQFRRAIGKENKPNFLKWKNEAIETYCAINKAFASKNVESVRERMCEFVYFALGKRQTGLPKNVSLGWDLVKFNSKPKLISFHQFPHDDGSILLLQIIYKFDTKQRLSFKKIGSGKKDITEQVKDLTEYVAFNVDPYTDKIVLAGSVFESPVERELTPKAMPSQEETVNNMIKNADIYRIEKKDVEKLE